MKQIPKLQSKGKLPEITDELFRALIQGKPAQSDTTSRVSSGLTRQQTEKKVKAATTTNLLNEALEWITNKLGMLDDFRRLYTINKKLGTYTPYKVGNNWQWDANGRLFGKRIGEGSEQDVFENLKKSNEVLKILSQGYATKSDMRKGVLIYNKRNNVPMSERAKFVGYMLGLDAATRTKEVYYPVFSQKKLTIPTDQSFTTWDNTTLPELEKLMKEHGIKVVDHTYTYGKYSISDLSPANIGKDERGNWRFIDAFVE